MNCDQILLCPVSCGPYGLWDFGLSQTKDDHRRRRGDVVGRGSKTVALRCTVRRVQGRVLQPTLCQKFKMTISQWDSCYDCC